MFIRKVAFLWMILSLSALSLWGQDRGLDVKIKKIDPTGEVGKQWLAIIAINRYEEWPNLQNPISDAEVIKDVLTRRYYFDEVWELNDEQATKANIMKLLIKMQRKLGAHDSMLIYYAGHGYLDKNTDSGFWIPHDAGLDEFAQKQWLPNSQIRGAIRNMKAMHICLISDACFSGDILDVTRAKPDRIDDTYFRRAYRRISRQVLTSGASETVPDRSEFAFQLKMALEKNNRPYLDPLMLYNDIRLGIRRTIPLLGSLQDAGHQQGGSFLLFLKDRESEAELETQRKTAEDEKVASKSRLRELGTEKNPIVWAVVPSGEMEQIASGTQTIIDLLHEKTGLHFETSARDSHHGVVDALASDPPKVHMVSLNTLFYLHAAEEGVAEAALVSLRFGSATYNGQTIVGADTGIKKLTDLKGRTFARPDPSSTSGWIVPMMTMRAAGVNPEVDLKSIVDAGGHPAVVSAVYNGDVDAGSTYVDARASLKQQYPDVMDKVKVIDVTIDIPNDGIQFHLSIPKELRNNIVKALLEIAQTEKGKTALMNAYQWGGLEEHDDHFYDPLRQLLKASGVNIKDLVK